MARVDSVSFWAYQHKAATRFRIHRTKQCCLRAGLPPVSVNGLLVVLAGSCSPKGPGLEGTCH